VTDGRGEASAPNRTNAAGEKTGPWRESDDHGGYMSGAYRNGQRIGTWRHYFANGDLRAEGEYMGGILHEPWVWYRKDGQVMQRGGFRQGEKHGTWQRWSADGAQIDEGDFDMGKKVGEWKKFAPDGTVAKVTQHRSRS
jgi:antitoxin component YwqK of YwqJK toxin-antitoxin module